MMNVVRCCAGNDANDMKNYADNEDSSMMRRHFLFPFVLVSPPFSSRWGIVSLVAVLPDWVGSVTERFVCFVSARDGCETVNDDQTAVYRIISGLDQLQ